MKYIEWTAYVKELEKKNLDSECLTYQIFNKELYIQYFTYISLYVYPSHFCTFESPTNV